jgi:hypothetical protein
LLEDEDDEVDGDIYDEDEVEHDELYVVLITL